MILRVVYLVGTLLRANLRLIIEKKLTCIFSAMCKGIEIRYITSFDSFPETLYLPLCTSD